MDNQNNDARWLTSKEAKAKLNITDCKLMHLRLKGDLEYKKVGRSFYYRIK